MEELLKYLEADGNSIPDNAWKAIVSRLDKDNATVCANAVRVEYRGEVSYCIPLELKKKLRHILPFMPEVKPMLLAERSSINNELFDKCGACNGPYHSATGHVFIVGNKVMGVGCGICCGKFFAQQLKKDGWKFVSGKVKAKTIRRQEKLKSKWAKLGWCNGY